MAKEHGMIEHKGKTIPAEVKSLADRIRKKEPGKGDEYAYRTAWDIYRSYTQEGKGYPHKSPESGLAREGGGTGPLSKKAASNFWDGFIKAAQKTKILNRIVHPPKTVQPITKPPKIPFAGEAGINYKKINDAEIAKARARPSTSYKYDAKGNIIEATGPGVGSATGKDLAQQKAKDLSQKVITNSLKGGYVQPQYERVGLTSNS